MYPWGRNFSLEVVEEGAGGDGVLAAPLVDHIASWRVGEWLEGGGEFAALSIDEWLYIVASTFGKPQLDQELNA
jgi:hypothetical protein